MMKNYNFFFWLLAIGIFLINCNNSQDKKEDAGQIKGGSPIISVQSNSNLEILLHEARLGKEKKILQLDNYLGDINLIVLNDSNNEEKKTKLNKFVSASRNEFSIFQIQQLDYLVKSNDSGERLLDIRNENLSIDFDPSTETYQNLKLSSSNLGVLDKDGLPLMVGNSVESFLKKYKDTIFRPQKIQSEGKLINTFSISLSQFINKETDQYIYVNYNDDGIITEIGSWENY